MSPVPTTWMPLSCAQRVRCSKVRFGLVAREKWEWMWRSATSFMPGSIAQGAIAAEKPLFGARAFAASYVCAM